MGDVWKVRVAVVDDHPLFRAGLTAALGRETDLEIAGEAGDREAAKTLIDQPIDVAILDVLMPGASGITIASEIRERVPTCRILALSVIDEPCLIAQMFQAGASGYALKTQPIADIIDAIRQVIGGVRYLPPSVSRLAVERAIDVQAESNIPKLTRREREIFELMIRGFSSLEIAARLFIAVRTVETHRHRIAKKLSTRSIVEMQRLAARHGGL